MSACAAVFLFAMPAAVYAVVQVVGDGAAAGFAVAAVPRSPWALWGSFPAPRAAQRIARRIGAVALIAQLAWAAA